MQALYILNPQIDSLDLWDALSERLCKASSLTQFALSEDITDSLNTDLRNYLWALRQFIQEACEIYQALGYYQGINNKE
jgi:hypothetical protein